MHAAFHLWMWTIIRMRFPSNWRTFQDCKEPHLLFYLFTQMNGFWTGFKRKDRQCYVIITPTPRLTKINVLRPHKVILDTTSLSELWSESLDWATNKPLRWSSDCEHHVTVFGAVRQDSSSARHFFEEKLKAFFLEFSMIWPNELIMPGHGDTQHAASRL